MAGFFGGNPDVAHFSVQVRRYDSDGKKRSRAEIAADRETLKAAGYLVSQQFSFHTNNSGARAMAKGRADAAAAKIMAYAGVSMDVTEGAYL